jgi:simple sugar transport system permease protein
VLLAGLLFGALRAGGREMQGAAGIPIDLVLVLQALIIVMIAAPELVRAIYRIRTPEQESGTTLPSGGWGG